MVAGEVCQQIRSADEILFDVISCDICAGKWPPVMSNGASSPIWAHKALFSLTSNQKIQSKL